MLEQQFREIVVRELRNRGWTRADLAREMGTTPQYVTNYLRGYHTPGPDVIEKFFRAFGLSPDLRTKPLKLQP